MSKVKKLFRLLFDPFILLIIYWPGELGFILRGKYYRKKLKSIGKDVKIDVGVHFQNPQFISIGNNCWIDRGVVIIAGIDSSSREKILRSSTEKFKGKPGEVIISDNVHVGIGCIISGISSGVYIGNNCCFSAGCKVYAFSHHYKSKQNPTDTSICFGSMVPHDKQCLIQGPVMLEDNVGVALHSILLPGTTLRKNSFVLIGSVVSGEYEENSLMGGNPAKVVKERFK